MRSNRFHGAEERPGSLDPVRPLGARNEPGRIREVRRTSLAYPHRRCGVSSGDLAGSPRVIEVNVGQDDVRKIPRGDAERYESRRHGVGGRPRSRFDERRLVGLDEVRGRDQVSTDHSRVDPGDPARNGKRLVHRAESSAVTPAC